MNYTAALLTGEATSESRPRSMPKFANHPPPGAQTNLETKNWSKKEPEP